MRRREFILALGGTVTAWPFAARAQWNEPIRRIGVMMSIADDQEGQRRLRALREGLARLGWSEGKTVRIEVRWSVSNAERARAVAKELIGGTPDLILTSGTAATVAVHRATTTVPVVFTVVSEPVEQGLVQSLARPAGNITGFSNLEPSLGGKWIGTAQSHCAEPDPRRGDIQSADGSSSLGDVPLGGCRGRKARDRVGENPGSRAGRHRSRNWNTAKPDRRIYSVGGLRS
jgi:hypothetical protein